MKTSEFGKGLTYCIGLFLAHAERTQYDKSDYSLWFNGAADHLYEIESADNMPEKLKKKISEFQYKCLHWRLTKATKEDFEWALEEAKTILIQIDKFIGLKPIKADWE